MPTKSRPGARTWAAAAPCLVAAAPVLALWSNNVSEVDAQVALIPLVLAPATAAILLAALGVLLRDVVRGAAVTAVIVLSTLGYGYLARFVWELGWFETVGGVDRMLAPVCVVAVVGAGTWCARTRVDLVKPVGIAGAMAATLLALSGGQLALAARASTWPGTAAEPGTPSVERFGATATGPPAEPLLREAAETPDIYYIIVDGYARQDVLRRFYGYDNEPFLRALEQRGFYVARESAANYPFTYPSLASSLNGVYLDEFADAVGRSDSVGVFTGLIRNHWAGRFLRARGYRYAQNSTTLSSTETSDIADLEYAYRPRWLRSEFVQVLLDTTALRSVQPSVAAFHLWALDAIAEVAEVEGPVFLLAHLLLPHDPFIFDAAGNARAHVPLHRITDPRVKKQLGRSDLGEPRYTEQVRFLNRRLLRIVDELLERSPVRPVIVLQADHGWSVPVPRGSSRRDSREQYLATRLPILNAYYVPEAVERRLYPAITPVNTFRILFSELFGAGTRPIPDRIYTSTRESPTEWEDVTRIVTRFWSVGGRSGEPGGAK